MSTINLQANRGAQYRKTVPQKYFEGWLEHESNGSWNRYWVIIRGCVMLICRDRNDSNPQSHVGSLMLGPSTRMRNFREKKKHFLWELITTSPVSNHSSRVLRLNKFRCESLLERDLWKGYLLGISTGVVPRDLDSLMPGHLESLHQAINNFRLTGGRDDTPPTPPSTQTMPSMKMQQFRRHTESELDHRARSSAILLASRGKSVDYGQVHRFYSDQNMNGMTPGWFLGNCSREQSEMLLLNCKGGSVLMRESSNFKYTGTYVISHMKQNRDIVHYQVMTVSGGFQINVNPTPPIQDCLHDVMRYFISKMNEVGESTSMFGDSRSSCIPAPPLMEAPAPPMYRSGDDPANIASGGAFSFLPDDEVFEGMDSMDMDEYYNLVSSKRIQEGPGGGSSRTLGKPGKQDKNRKGSVPPAPPPPPVVAAASTPQSSATFPLSPSGPPPAPPPVMDSSGPSAFPSSSGMAPPPPSLPPPAPTLPPPVPSASAPPPVPNCPRVPPVMSTGPTPAPAPPPPPPAFQDDSRAGPPTANSFSAAIAAAASGGLKPAPPPSKPQSKPAPSDGGGVEDFADELRRKLQRKFIYSTPEEFKALRQAPRF